MCPIFIGGGEGWEGDNMVSCPIFINGEEFFIQEPAIPYSAAITTFEPAFPADTWVIRPDEPYLAKLKSDNLALNSCIHTRDGMLLKETRFLVFSSLHYNRGNKRYLRKHGSTYAIQKNVTALTSSVYNWCWHVMQERECSSSTYSYFHSCFPWKWLMPSYKTNRVP